MLALLEIFWGLAYYVGQFFVYTGMAAVVAYPLFELGCLIVWFVRSIGAHR